MPTVLVLDDSVLIRSLVSAALNRCLINVLPSHHSQEALMVCQRRSIAAVLTDLTLPDGDGLSLCRTLKQLKPALPVVLMSGIDLSELELPATYPPDYTLQKPFTIQELQVLMLRVLETPARLVR